ncbi:hypothetical protein NKL07_20265 [Mesorhizobium sp. C280B]|uniref:hypothetical protein n=1 Tax=unclassified Mesorhizobium TaxID=325217 RepID=UPI0018DD833E|nr:hypothetical protein [Mesorhizobium sp. LSJC280B00]
MTDHAGFINGQRRKTAPPACSHSLDVNRDVISRSAADASGSDNPNPISYQLGLAPKVGFGSHENPTGLRRMAKSWELRKDVFHPPLSGPARLSTSKRAACPASRPGCLEYCPRRQQDRDYFLAFAFAGAAFGLAAGAAFFTAAEDFAAAAFAGAAFFAAGFAAAFAAGFLAGAAFFAGAALALAGAAFALAGAAFFTAGFAAALAAGFLAGAAFALGAAAFALAAGAAFFTAVAAFAAAAFAGAFFAGDFAGALDAGALDDCLAISCPFRCADGRY